MRLHTFLLLGLATVHLTSCAYVGRNVQRAGTEMHEGTVAFDQRLRNWLYSDAADVEESRKPKPHTGYCYRTLGQVSCHPHPIAGQKTRMVGLQMPEPTFTELNTPIPVGKPQAAYVDLAQERKQQEEAEAQLRLSAPQSSPTPESADAYGTELSGKPVIYDAPEGGEVVLLPMIQPQGAASMAPQPLMP